MKLKNADEVFATDLCEPEYAAGYVNISLEEDGVEGLLYSLQKVSKARGMTKVAEESGLNRETLYRTLSPAGNPTIKSLHQLASVLGLRLAILPSSIDHFELPGTQSSLPLELEGVLADLRGQVQSLRVLEENARQFALKRSTPLTPGTRRTTKRRAFAGRHRV